MTQENLFAKDPQSNLDYQFDWSEWLVTGDTIASSAWTIETGITQGVTSFTDTTTRTWLSGGTAGETYQITNKITTAGGRIAERSIFIVVKQR